MKDKLINNYFDLLQVMFQAKVSNSCWFCYRFQFFLQSEDLILGSTKFC